VPKKLSVMSLDICWVVTAWCGIEATRITREGSLVVPVLFTLKTNPEMIIHEGVDLGRIRFSPRKKQKTK
jgi:hypothetical protein